MKRKTKAWLFLVPCRPLGIAHVSSSFSALQPPVVTLRLSKAVYTTAETRAHTATRNSYAEGAPKRVGRGSRKRRRRDVRRPAQAAHTTTHGATKIYDSRGPAPQAQEELPVVRGVRRTAPVAAK